jgi:uncharacterized SAM-binding protein YcdF (DUF218 family)
MVSLLPKTRWRRWLAVVAVVVVLFLGVSARLFIWPPTDAPAHVDAIVALDGYPSRTGKAIELGQKGYAPTVVLSVLSLIVPPCHERVPGVRILCFVPNPLNTRGEAEYVAALAARRHWTSLLVVSSSTQTTRARMDMKRCFSGTLLMDPVQVPLSGLPRQIFYEWGALTKALVVYRHC